MIKDKNIDAIYIATLNNTHKDLILQILKSEKHILCEKPFVIDLEQALKINQNVISSSKKFFITQLNGVHIPHTKTTAKPSPIEGSIFFEIAKYEHIPRKNERIIFSTKIDLIAKLTYSMSSPQYILYKFFEPK